MGYTALFSFASDRYYHSSYFWFVLMKRLLKILHCLINRSKLGRVTLCICGIQNYIRIDFKLLSQAALSYFSVLSHNKLCQEDAVVQCCAMFLVPFLCSIVQVW